ncbi:hypothetical protein Salat_2041000 [Sesamum alatum]|uniref:Uncharacterized protein n=1 Tax=Sesamum alatum TaxID=300844 RepID=A0AAE2CG74_9LAMI|nr:hypothetical protein Salat_2041000 [Sesamum alatum]
MAKRGPCFSMRQISRQIAPNTSTNFTSTPSFKNSHTHTDLQFHLKPYSERQTEAMVVAIGPCKFYGSSLPRPRIYTDLRIDPPLPREKFFKKSQKRHQPAKDPTGSGPDIVGNSSRDGKTPSPPPAPAVIKRRRVVGLVDEDEEDEQREMKRRAAKKLGDDLERVAGKSGMNGSDEDVGTVATRTRSKMNEANVIVNQGKVNKRKRKMV